MNLPGVHAADCRPRRRAIFAALLLVFAAGDVPAASSGPAAGSGPAAARVPAIEIPGARTLSQAEIEGREAPPIPLPAEAPLSFERADSIIQILDADPTDPRTRYDLFPIDLDGDGREETIAQVARIAAIGIYSRAWWGIYGDGGRAQVLFWSQGNERSYFSRLRRPEVLPTAADSLGFFGSLPFFHPAIEIVSVGDLTGDGRPETVLLLAQREQSRTIRAILSFVLLSPDGDRVGEVFRTRVLQVDHARGPGDESEACAARGFRVWKRPGERESAPAELLLEPWTPEPPDSLCRTLLTLDERSLPSDLEDWMPAEPRPAGEPVPPGSFLVRWDGKRFSIFEGAGE